MENVSPNDPVTKEVLDKWVETILNGMKKIFDEQTKRFDKQEAEQKEFDTLKSE